LEASDEEYFNGSDEEYINDADYLDDVVDEDFLAGIIQHITTRLRCENKDKVAFFVTLQIAAQNPEWFLDQDAERIIDCAKNKFVYPCGKSKYHPKVYIVAHWCPEPGDEPTESDGASSDDSSSSGLTDPEYDGQVVRVAAMSRRYNVDRLTPFLQADPLPLGELPVNAPSSNRKRKRKVVEAVRTGARQPRRARRQMTKHEPWAPTYNPAYYSMRLMKTLFPKIKRQAFMQDLYKRKRPITKDGKRLTGTAPYDDDPALGEHHALTWELLEDAILAGGI